RLVDDLLDLTRISRGKVELRLELVDAHAAIRNAVASLQGEMDAKRLEITLALRAAVCHVWADPQRFQQILLNLLSNAIKFTTEDGSLRVRSSNENGVLRIDVSDSGVGIEPSVLPKLFIAFEQGGADVHR